MLGIFSLNAAGLQGAILQGVNHGLSTGALFFLVGILYEQRHTREMAQFGGIWRVVPVFSALSLVVVLSSMGLPGLNGFVGEFTILLGSMGAEQALGANAWIYTAFATSGVILAAIYLLWMFQRVFMGPLDNEENKSLKDVRGRDLAVFLAFLLFIIWIGINPDPYFGLMDTSVEALVEHLGSAITVMR
jgi:NADH-quinone oxidoreductase subunit M